MKRLLEQYFAQSYKSTKIITVEERIEKGDFSTTDDKSCNDCNKYFSESCGEKEVSLHKSDKEIHIIRFEDIFQKFSNIKDISQGGCCDLLMYSDEKIAVTDMTCSRPQYLEQYEVCGKQKPGKRAYAYKQMEDSIRKLRHCDEINRKIDSYSHRIAIFSVRKKVFALESVPSDVAKQMNGFSKMSDQIQHINIRTDMGNGFHFIVQEYPNVYQW